MNETKKRRGRGGLIALLVIVVLLALICAAPFVINATTHLAYDDYETLAEGWERLFYLSVAADGEHLLFHMDRNGFYRLMLDNDVLASVQEETGGRVAVEQIGYLFRAGLNELEVHAAVKAFGFLPAQLRALADVSVEGDSLRITPREVWYGNRIRIGAEKLAKWTGMDELVDGFTVSLRDWTEPLRADAVVLEGEGFTIVSPLLGQVIDEVAKQPESDDLRLLRLYFGGDELTPAFFGDGRADFIRAAGTSLGALRTALRDVVMFGTDEYRCALSDDLSVLPFDLNSEIAKLSLKELWEAQRARVAETQAMYHTTQVDVRNDYWHKNVMLKQGRLTEMDGTLLEERLPTEWEARVVLQYNENYDAIVKTNEGNPRLFEPIPGLPMMSELKRDSRASLPPEGDGPFDLSIALRLPSGIPAVVFLTAEDEYGLAVISEELFSEIKENPRIPIYSSKDIAAAPRSEWLRLYLGEDQITGNYIGLE